MYNSSKWYVLTGGAIDQSTSVFCFVLCNRKNLRSSLYFFVQFVTQDDSWKFTPVYYCWRHTLPYTRHGSHPTENDCERRTGRIIFYFLSAPISPPLCALWMFILAVSPFQNYICVFSFYIDTLSCVRTCKGSLNLAFQNYVISLLS